MRFHDLRHEAGLRLVEAGWPLHHVQEMLGDADLQTTSIDLNVTRTGLAESMRRFGNAPALQSGATKPATLSLGHLARSGSDPSSKSL
jgi:hypothetical protein